MEIAYQANEEAQCENKLKEIENIAQKTKMFIIPHKDVRDAFILTGLDELQIIIDDMNMNVNNLASSRHIDFIKPEVNKWQKLTDQLYKTLGIKSYFKCHCVKFHFCFYFFFYKKDELITCQTNWMYLQAIFAAPDIQRQIPEEARIFAEIDKKWKELMGKAFIMNLALPFLTNRDNYEILKINNSLLETVIKRLEAYLEVKRTAFPRYRKYKK